MKESKIVPVNQVRLRIPRKYLLKRFDDCRYLYPEESAKLVHFLRVLEKKIALLEHVRSVVNKILLRSG